MTHAPCVCSWQLSLSPTGGTRRASLIRERVKDAGRRCYTAVLIVALLAAAAGGIRLGFAPGSRKEWALYLLVIPSQVKIILVKPAIRGFATVPFMLITGRLNTDPRYAVSSLPISFKYSLDQPPQVAVCLLPMSLPIYLAAGEAVATARLLAFLELILRRKRYCISGIVE